MPGPRSRERLRHPIEYRDRQGRLWYASEVAKFKAVSPAIDGPNLCLVIRFEREGEEQLATRRVVIMFRAMARRSSRSINMAYAQRRPRLRRR